MNNNHLPILTVLKQDIFEFLSYRAYFKLAITPRELPADATMNERMDNSVFEVRRDNCFVRLDFDTGREEFKNNFDHLLRAVLDAEAALLAGSGLPDSPYRPDSKLKLLLTAVRERTWECCKAREAYTLAMASHRAFSDLVNAHYKFVVTPEHVDDKDFKQASNCGYEGGVALANIVENRQAQLTEPLNELKTYIDSVLAVGAGTKPAM
jgi:hypothetical protein